MTQTKLTVEDLEQVAKLARLKLTPEELTQFTKEIGGVLEYASQVSAISERNAEVSGEDGYADQFSESVIKDTVREDVISSSSEKTLKELLADAPEVKDNFIKVTQVLAKHKN